jgi:hypothetical protein
MKSFIELNVNLDRLIECQNRQVLALERLAELIGRWLGEGLNEDPAEPAGIEALGRIESETQEVQSLDDLWKQYSPRGGNRE